MKLCKFGLVRLEILIIVVGEWIVYCYWLVGKFVSLSMWNRLDVLLFGVYEVYSECGLL